MPKTTLSGRSIAVVIEQDKVLLVRSNKSPDAWVPPGGHIEPREPAAAAAAREVFEETGVAVTVGRLVGYREVWWPDHDTLELYFSACRLPTAAAESEEGRESRWVQVATLDSVAHFPESLAKLCAVAASHDQPPLHLGALDLRTPDAGSP